MITSHENNPNMESNDKKIYNAPALKIVNISMMGLVCDSNFKTEEMTQSQGGWGETE